MRAALVSLLALAGCNEGALMLGGDGGADLATTSSPDLAGFCGDPSSPRAEVNGMLANSPAPLAKALFLNCCDAAEVSLVSMQLKEPLVLTWRHQVGSMPNLPATLDLAHLPAGWTVTLYSGCSPSQPGCTPTDSYDSGLTGTLTVSGGGASYQMSACLSASETPANKHPVLHAVRVWIPTQTAQ